MPWSRTSRLSADAGGDADLVETWTSPGGEAFDVVVTVGKEFDVLALKGVSLDEVREYERLLRRSAAELYGAAQPKRPCPCCATPSADAEVVLHVFGVAYVRCSTCSHGFVREQPSVTALDALFQSSDDHSSTYTDAAAVETRMAQVVRPKVDWALRTWAAAIGGEPRSVVDVGAGGGHMLAGFRDAGLDPLGYELSTSSRRFASEMFGLDLLGGDFVTASGDVDLVTFWGLLEYTVEPAAFVDAARRRLDGSGMLIVEVPRFDALGTAVQAAPDAVVSRHLDPTTHVNCFSDESLVTLLHGGGFRPVAAWYFGMDAYELLVQLALRLDDPDAIEEHSQMLLSLQPTLDRARLCDDIVIAAVPV